MFGGYRPAATFGTLDAVCVAARPVGPGEGVLNFIAENDKGNLPLSHVFGRLQTNVIEHRNRPETPAPQMPSLLPDRNVSTMGPVIRIYVQ